MSRINLIVWDNGVGLSSDMRLLSTALGARGHVVTISALRRGKLRKVFRPWQIRARILGQRLRGRNVQTYDVNLFLEHARPEYFPLARRNVLIPNPEWFDAKDEAALPAIDHLFVKTHHAEAIFCARGCNTTFTGFTSPDRRDASVPRERKFFHLAGRSQNKNTEALLTLWRKHPQWPQLTVVQNPRTAQPGPPAANIVHRVDYLADEELKRLQNAHCFHLCPSQTEGFGHYLVEAMSLGATTLTLDAAPMNELVGVERGVLVPVARTETQNLAVTNFFDDDAMQAAIEDMMALEDADLERIGAAARRWYEDNDRAFRERIDAAVSALST
jgi:Glycosyl transferases group 1